MAETTPTRDLTQRSACELAQGIRAGLWSATEVAEAHIARIESINPRLNAVVVKLFDQARREAMAVDEARQSGEPLGLLAGVPITVKESFDIEGTATTLGLPHRAQRSAPADAALVRRLRHAGGVILGKTNVPQLMILHETENPLYGRTLHPDNPARSPGGSSGGEATIIAAHGSALGLASDLGGSIRQPAHSTGICGFKPTTCRLPSRGSTSVFTGLEVLGGQPGPMARSVDDLMLAMRVLATPEKAQVDAVTPPLGWRDALAYSPASWRIGFWLDDGFQRPSPAIRRAVQEAADTLSAAGVHVEPFEPPDVEGAMQLYFHLVSANGGRAARRLIGSDPRNPAIHRLIRLGQIPPWMRPAIGGALRLFGQDRMAWLVANTGPISAGEFWRLTNEARQYQLKVLDRMNHHGLTALLSAPHALVALTHGSAGYLSLAAAPSKLINVLGFPAGVIPWTRVRPGEESDRRASHDLVERAALAVEAGSAGLPVGVQVIGRPWDDEATLALMAVLEGLHSRNCGETSVSNPA